MPRGKILNAIGPPNGATFLTWQSWCLCLNVPLVSFAGRDVLHGKEVVAFCFPRSSWLRIGLHAECMCVDPGLNPSDSPQHAEIVKVHSEAPWLLFSFSAPFPPEANISHLTSGLRRTHLPLPEEN